MPSVPRLRYASPAALLLLAAAAASQPTPGTIVVPSAWASREAPGVAFWALSPFAARRQLLIGPGHLSGAAGQSLRALEVRRNTGDNGPYGPGQVQLRVTLSHSPRAAGDPSETFARNRGPDEQVVFSGTVAMPVSLGSPTTPAPWLPPHSVLVPFGKPFRYTGGTLCIETETSPVSGGPIPTWWPVDAVVERPGGGTARFGAGCLPATPGADPRSLVLGSTAVVHLRGGLRDGTSGFCMLGTDASRLGTLPLPFEMGPLGAPGCWIHVAPAFVARARASTLQGTGFGLAVWRFQVPVTPALANRSVYNQWVWPDAGANPLGLTFSEGLRMSLGGPPQLGDSSWVESPDSSAAAGEILRGRMPVLRFHM